MTPEFTVDWFSQNIPVLSAVLAEHIGKPVRYLEIGAFEGRSTVWFCENILTHPESRILVVDTWNGSIEHLELGIQPEYLFEAFCRNCYDYRSKIATMKGRSQDWLPMIHGQFECVYVDGSHDAKDVLVDAINAHRLLAPEGFLIFDDYEFFEPNFNLKPATGIDAFLEVYKDCYDVIWKSWQLICRKRRNE